MSRASSSSATSGETDDSLSSATIKAASLWRSSWGGLSEQPDTALALSSNAGEAIDTGEDDTDDPQCAGIAGACRWCSCGIGWRKLVTCINNFWLSSNSWCLCWNAFAIAKFFSWSVIWGNNKRRTDISKQTVLLKYGNIYLIDITVSFLVVFGLLRHGPAERSIHQHE